MYGKDDLLKGFETLGINPLGTLMVHSSMKALGDVEGGAQTVLDALCEYMAQGLLLMPTHTWDRAFGEDDYTFDVLTSPSCCGILTNLLRKRDGAVRSLHPTHSIAALGKGAQEYVRGEETATTPCPPRGCWGRLNSENTQILFLGCSFARNTFIHSVEEAAEIPCRLSKARRVMHMRDIEGNLHTTQMCSHDQTNGDISRNYGKIIPVLSKLSIARTGKVCDGDCCVIDAARTFDAVMHMLSLCPHLFLDDSPIPAELFAGLSK